MRTFLTCNCGRADRRVGSGLRLPGNLDDVPLLAVEDGLDAVNAPRRGLGIGSDVGLVGAPEVRKMRP